MKNRKFWIYVIAVVAIMILNILGVGGSEAITTLAISLFTANVVQKNEHFTKKECE